jgi:ATP adenylyltransferase/5',5'''-P-1,P-4-tetraphosphate phosphorylase II
VADQAVLVAPPGPDQHLATPADLDTEHLARMLPLSFDSAFLEQFGLTGLEVVSFMNLGVPAAQSRRHPHLQIVGFSPERCNRAAGDPAGVAEELASAATEGRSLPVGPAKGIAVIPRQPSMTAELWIPRPEGAAAADRTWAACVQSVTTACTRAISGAYNLVIRRDPRMVRIVPRGLSERAGLELASPHVVDSVVAASVEETHALWAAALSVVAGEPA